MTRRLVNLIPPGRLLVRLLLAVPADRARHLVADHSADTARLAAELIVDLDDHGGSSRLRTVVAGVLGSHAADHTVALAAWLSATASDRVLLDHPDSVDGNGSIDPDDRPVPDRSAQPASTLDDCGLDLPLIDLARDLAAHPLPGRVPLRSIAVADLPANIDGQWDTHTGAILIARRLVAAGRARRTGEVFAHELAHALDPDLAHGHPARDERFADLLGQHLLEAQPHTVAVAARLIDAAALRVRSVDLTPLGVPSAGVVSLAVFEHLFSGSSSEGAVPVAGDLPARGRPAPVQQHTPPGEAA